MLSCRSETSATTVSPVVGLPQVERGRLLGGVGVERLALVVGVDRALDQAPGLRGGHVAAHLDPVRLVGQRHLRRPRTRPAASRSGSDSHGCSRRASHGSHSRTPSSTTSSAATAPRGPRARAASSRRRRGPEQQPDQDRQQPEDRAAQGRRQRHVDQRVPHLGDLALGLAGDVGVALDQLLGGLRVGLASRMSTPTRPPEPIRKSGSTGPVLHDDLAEQVRPEHRVVAGQHDRAAAQQEQRQPGDRGEHGPDGEVRRRPGDQGGAPEHALPRGVGHGSPWSFRCDQARARAMA